MLFTGKMTVQVLSCAGGIKREVGKDGKGGTNNFRVNWGRGVFGRTPRLRREGGGLASFTSAQRTCPSFTVYDSDYLILKLCAIMFFICSGV